MALKQILVGTAPGRLVMALRDRIERLRATAGIGEEAGMLANDRLALILATRLARPGTGFVDVGAHIGSVLAEAARLPGVALFAVEAMPDKAASLRRRFPQAQIFECAASEAEGETRFFVDVARSGYSSLAAGHRKGAEIREIQVVMRRLDDLIADMPIDVIKIDVEGAELGVLRGAEALVAASRPTIMFESGPEPALGLGYTIEGLWDWFEAQDYAVLVPNRVAHHDAGLGRDGFVEAHLYPRRTTNYLAVARERRDEARARARAVLGLATSA